MRKIRMISAVLAAVMLAMPVVAPAKDAARIAVTPASKEALLVIKAPALRPAPTFKTAYRLGLSVYDAENQSMKGGPWGGKAVFEAQPKKFVDGYLLLTVKPGTWVFQDFSQQDRWALCFQDGSRQFDVAAGEVVYLGEFDALAHAIELQRIAVMTLRTSTTGFEHFFENVTPPRLTPAGEADLDAVRAMLTARSPGTTAPLRAASYTPARFGTGSDLFGLSRVCGGYYTGKAKQKAE
ncbi:hypothetical protein L7H23_14380 [Sphingopyxis sp. BSN-002]|uniref:hypothetical protein n=1 Tax=Sphingopyxis sp. BSN-002 TaxID=2911495 RepID=UPI001EDC350E|nr:hypothetical protein [Sphingopyxis sp. BSN-002]UKK83745.1 hypothetical protein L7H23_14380 [Sphingopyxis sp. BSN-002]